MIYLENKEKMKTLTFADVTYEIVDEQARNDISATTDRIMQNADDIKTLNERIEDVAKETQAAYDHANAKGSQYASGLYKIATNSSGHVSDATPVTLSDITSLGVTQSDWNQSDSSAIDYIKNKPDMVNGSGKKSIVIGSGKAQGDYSVAGGTNDKKLIADLAGSLISSHASIDTPTAYGDMSLSFGAGTKSYSTGSLAIGANSTAGCLGFYWHSIDWSGTNPVIQLSTEQKPYRYYNILGQKIEQNKTPTWTEEAVYELENWRNQHVTIVNNIKYGESSQILSVDLANGRITVDSLPFTEEDVKVEFSSLSDISALVLSFDDYAIYCPNRPSAGLIEFAYGALSLGLMTNASGSFATALGYNTKVTTDFGHAEGRETIAAYAAHAEGYQTKALGRGSHTEGTGTLADGLNAHAEGSGTYASGDYAHTEGKNSYAAGYSSHAEGGGSNAGGDYAHAEGVNTNSLGYCSHTEGYGTETHVDAAYAHAEGYQTRALQSSAHAEGSGTLADAKYAHSEGVSTKALGVASHAQGSGSQAIGIRSHAEGFATIAIGTDQHVQGKGNSEDKITTEYPNGRYAHIIGNGYISATSERRSNAHTVDWDGNATFAGYVSSRGEDYAEFFEWSDGNPNNEDRVGLLVTLDGEKIRLANADDEVLGIISGTVAVLGGNYEWEWNGKYLTDDFGRIIYEDVEEFDEVIVGEDEEGNPIIEKQSLGFFKHPALNPDYEPTKQYINRADRPEWSAVGMIGKLYVCDDGTCEVNGYAAVGKNGIATASSEKTNMRVLSRVCENIVRVLLK